MFFIFNRLLMFHRYSDINRFIVEQKYKNNWNYHSAFAKKNTLGRTKALSIFNSLLLIFIGACHPHAKIPLILLLTYIKLMLNYLHSIVCQIL
ncbi:hypothetical protein EZS27_021989 [termite gut metagenome]|uniref:Uncharacterized protein n=1 Tax=termite gut metagenome TaxID=433724 RepID=A0A5J4R621_9ZZZZ